MEYVIALDVGGTNIKAALIGRNGSVLCKARRPTALEHGPQAVVRMILDFAEELAADGRRRLGEGPAAIGLAVPGTVDQVNGVAGYAVNLGWRDVPFRALLGERLGAHEGTVPFPVALGHDLRSGGLAELRLGAARGVDRFLFVALGTGIAAAIGLEGRIEPGASGSAGEIGHIIVRPGGLRCPCGQRGCLERYASASAVSRAWAAASGMSGATAADCAQAVANGDAGALATWQYAVDALADGLTTGLTLLDPAAIIIGGGLAEAGETLLAPLRKAVAERIALQALPEIIRAQLGDEAACLGAGLIAWDLIV
ncbi:ROK family protein [Actinoplanes sp. Pm04-4]|uniref:ROK family protein n=1 Tax=Paractinoplanes pyxinae TaxID=2997416 RepID=A0ABT4BDK2_9ACTN|nr:ROK family protein [Actinoplanes pyxinae]MCY1144072.1 ROK family protein [Actinoplanes pyxinae]